MPEGYDLSLLDLSGNHAAIQSLLHLPSFSVSDGEVSPNRQWLAYQSNESNGHDVYVRPFPDVNSRRWKVSPDGGVQPLWAPDGRELFYLAPTGTLMSVKVERGPTWTEASPTPMFDRVLMFAGAGNSEDVGRQYDIHPDGKRFLMIKLADAPNQATTPRSLVVVLNWFDELKRLVPGR